MTTTAEDLLREWYVWWSQSEVAPAKMPDGLHVRTALLLAPLAPTEHLTPFYLTQEEIIALACAVARSVEPGTKVDNAWDAANVVWAHRSQPDAGFLLTALATAFAEATPPPDPV